MCWDVNYCLGWHTGPHLRYMAYLATKLNQIKTKFSMSLPTFIPSYCFVISSWYNRDTSSIWYIWVLVYIVICFNEINFTWKGGSVWHTLQRASVWCILCCIPHKLRCFTFAHLSSQSQSSLFTHHLSPERRLFLLPTLPECSYTWFDIITVYIIQLTLIYCIIGYYDRVITWYSQRSSSLWHHNAQQQQFSML